MSSALVQGTKWHGIFTGINYVFCKIPSLISVYVAGCFLKDDSSIIWHFELVPRFALFTGYTSRLPYEKVEDVCRKI